MLANELAHAADQLTEDALESLGARAVHVQLRSNLDTQTGLMFLHTGVATPPTDNTLALAVCVADNATLLRQH